MSIYVMGGAEHEDEIERLREQLKHQCELNDAAAEDADALRRELAEARGLLREASTTLNFLFNLDAHGVMPGTITARIDAFLAADQPDPRNPTVKCRPFDFETGEPISSDKSSPG